MLISNLTSSLSKDAIISAIGGNHLIVYDRNLLKIYHSFRKFDNCIEYSREVALQLSIVIPQRANIREILVDKKGVFAFLIGRRNIYLVRICPEILSSKPDNLRSEYFCESFPIHDSFLLQNSSISVVQARILAQKINDIKVLAVLYSDSCVRFYNISQRCEGFLASVDFRPLMHLSAETSANNTFGLSKDIVSFDFKPTSDNSTNFVIFAVDSDAELYYSVVFSSCLTEGVTPKIQRFDTIHALPFNPIALQFVETSFPEIANVFLLLSGSNIVTHILTIATELGGFEIFMFDQLQLPASPGQPKIQAARSKSVYEIATSSSLFSIDISPWTSKFDSIDSNLPETSICEVLSIAGMETENKSSKSVKSVSISLHCGFDAPEGDAEFVEREILHLIVLDESSDANNHILAITKSASNSITDETQFHNESVNFPNIKNQASIEQALATMTPFPACVISERLSETDAISVALQFFESAEKRLEIHRELAAKAGERCVEVQLNSQTLGEWQQVIDERLLKETENVNNVMQNMFELKARVENVVKKINILASRIETNIPLSDVEIRMFDQLKTHQSMLSKLSITIPKLVLEVNEQKRVANSLSLRKGKNQPNKFANIEKNERDIENLEKRMENLKKIIGNIV